MSVLGNAVVRLEDPRFVAGGGRFVDDIPVDGSAHAVWVRFDEAHAPLVGVDTSEAAALAGVLGVFTAGDLGLPPTMANLFPNFPAAMERPLVASDRVRYVGEPVAVVVAESKAVAEDAAALVVVEYEPFDAVVDLDDAAADNVLLFPEHSTNVVMRMSSPASADFTDCAVVVALDLPIRRIVAPRWRPAPGLPGGKAGASSTTPLAKAPTRSATCSPGCTGWTPPTCRVVVPDVGGGFGVEVADVLGRGDARRPRSTGRPPGALGGDTQRAHGRQPAGARPAAAHHASAGRRDGRITAYQLDVLQDVGGYPLIGALLPGMTHAHAHRRLRHRQRRLHAQSRRDQQGADHGVPRRRSPGGHGGDRAGGRCVRRRDRHGSRRRPPAQPHPPLPRPVHHRDRDHLRRRRLRLRRSTGALDAAGYPELRAEQARRRAAGDRHLLGIGLGAYVEITAGGPGSEHATVSVGHDGRFRVVTGATPTGQGHDTTWAMVVADQAGVALADVDVVHGDTDLVPRGGLTVGSRSVQIAGATLFEATIDLVEPGV